MKMVNGQQFIYMLSTISNKHIIKVHHNTHTHYILSFSNASIISRWTNVWEISCSSITMTRRKISTKILHIFSYVWVWSTRWCTISWRYHICVTVLHATHFFKAYLKVSKATSSNSWVFKMCNSSTRYKVGMKWYTWSIYQAKQIISVFKVVLHNVTQHSSSTASITSLFNLSCKVL
jgi:hypothetical protein